MVYDFVGYIPLDRFHNLLTNKIKINVVKQVLNMNSAAKELIEDESIRNSEIAFPDLTKYNNLETYIYLGEEGDSLYNSLWKEAMSY